MKVRLSLSLFLAAALFATGCKQEAAKSAEEPAKKPAAKTGTSDEPAKPATQAAGSDHGSETPLGTVTIGAFRLEAAALGAIAPGNDAAVALDVKATPDGRDWRELNVYVWVEDADGQKLSAAEKAKPEKGRLHAHTSVTSGKPARLVVRLRDSGTDERQFIDLGADAGKGKTAAHTHAKTPHDGIVAQASKPDSEEPSAWLELKLHDDKGDLELWVTSNKALDTPLDLNTAATIEVTFVDHDNRKVTLAPRNTNKNEDEDGKPNMRDGKTNYFIFPGDTGADATWLKGKTFQSVVTVSIKDADNTLRSEEFVLKPHTHAPGTEHK